MCADRIYLASAVKRRYAFEQNTSVSYETAEEFYGSCGHNSISLNIKSKAVYLSASGRLRGKVWKSAGLCSNRKSTNKYPLIVLKKPNSDLQLAAVQLDEKLFSVHDIELRQSNAVSNVEDANPKFCCTSDGSNIAAWNTNTLKFYCVSQHPKSNNSTKYTLQALHTFQGSKLLELGVTEEDTFLAVLVSRGTLQFKFYRNDFSKPVDVRQYDFDIENITCSYLTCHKQGEIIIGNRHGRICTFNATKGMIAEFAFDEAKEIKCISINQGGNLIIVMVEKELVALDVAYQKLEWYDKVNGLCDSFSLQKILRKKNLFTRDWFALNWDEKRPNTIVLITKEEVIFIGINALLSGRSVPFKTVQELILSYTLAKDWERGSTLIDYFCNLTNDTFELLCLIEQVVSSKSLQFALSLKGLNKLVKHLSRCIESSLKLESGQHVLTVLKRITLSALLNDNFEVAVAIALHAGDKLLNEFVYTYLLQRNSGRLALICWSTLQNSNGKANADWQSLASKNILLSPATLKLLQETGKA